MLCVVKRRCSTADVAIGMTFERLTVLAEAGRASNGHRMVATRCSCGVEKIVSANNLASGCSRSCGCLHREESAERIRGRNTAHGQTMRGKKHPPTYVTWMAMRQRCNDRNAANYEYYGGRGITVCARWGSFANFLADLSERPEGMTLDRIDPDGNYEPGNCRWATHAEQQLNKRPR